VLDTTQIRKHFLLGFFTDRTGVEHHQIGFVKVVCGFVALGGVENIGQFVRVVLVHLAAKGFDEDFATHLKVSL